MSTALLAINFGQSRAAIDRILVKFTPRLRAVLQPMIHWPSKQQRRRRMPKHFRGFEDTAVIVDCTEFEICKTDCLHCNIQTYSNYKGYNTAKVLVGTAPSGEIIFASEPYCGRCSDNFIFLDSKILAFVEPGSCVMADKGFTTFEQCKQAGISLITPLRVSFFFQV